MTWEAGKNFLMGQGVYYVMAGIALIGFVCTTILYAAGRKLYKRSLKPDRGKKGYIGRMCHEFEEELKKRGNVNNVDNFVNNYLSINKFGIISLVSLDWFCGQLVYLCLLIGIVCGGLGYIWKVDVTQCINIAIFGAGLFGILLCIRKIANYGAKMEKVRLSMAAYFENKVIPEHIKRDNEKRVMEAEKEKEEKIRADKMARRSEQGGIVSIAGKEVYKLEPSEVMAAAGGSPDVSEQKEDVSAAGNISDNSVRSVDSKVGTQAKLLVQMNAVREFAQKTMESEKEKIREIGTGAERETAATLIRPLERESTRKTSQALTEKEEKIIADILKEYAK